MSTFRVAVAVAAGAVLACVLAYIGAVIVLLVTVGIPLGAPRHDPTATEYAVLLTFAGGASAIGGRAATRLAPSFSRRTVALALGTILAALVLWAFSGEGVQWPRWWAPTLAVTMAAGALVGNLAQIAR